MELHERVRYLRTVLQNDMSQKDFAAVLKVSRDEINNIEGNRLKRPDQKKSLLLLMCEKFGVSERWLIDGMGDPDDEIEDKEAAYVQSLLDEDNPFNDLIKIIMKTYSESKKEDQEAIKRFAKSLMDSAK